MTREELDALVGLNCADAEIKIKSNGLIPESLHEDSIVTMQTLPRNVVRLCYDDNAIVVSAETQESIDCKYM